jgi:hypothetical protein
LFAALSTSGGQDLPVSCQDRPGSGHVRTDRGCRGNSYLYSHFGDYIYVANNTVSPVLDIHTKGEVSSGWHVRPTDYIGQSWILVDHRNTYSQKCYEGFSSLNCNGDPPEQISLLRTPNGAYAGPWF